MEKLAFLAQLNQAQRLAIGITLCAVVILFFLHNPLSGYTTTRIIERTKVLEPCSENDRQYYREFLVNFYNMELGKDQRVIAEALGGVPKTIDLRVGNCHLGAPGVWLESSTIQELEEIGIPFSEWRTDNPLVEWLRPLVNFIYGVLTAFTIGAIFSFFVFWGKRDE